jgi:nitroreductase
LNATIDTLMAHRSIRHFTDQELDQKVIEQLIAAGQMAATSSFIQACTVIQVDDMDKRQALKACSGEQAYVASAPVFLVFCADMHRHQQACEHERQVMKSGYTEQFLTTSLDCALFAQNVVIAAESLGLGTVYIGGLRNQIQNVAELLELPELVYPVFGLCIGYPDQDPEIKPRLPLDVVLKRERYQDDSEEAMEAYDLEVSDYYRRRSSNNKASTWRGQIAAMLQREARPFMLEFLQKRGFLKR